MRQGRRRRRARRAGALVLVPAALLLAFCGSAPDGPRAPYAHPPMAESSVASAVHRGGGTGTVAEGLTGMGFGCAEGRANRVAVQVWCRRAPGPVEVQLVADPAGRLLYARFDLVLAGSPAADLRELLDATVLRVWPGDRDELAELVRDAAPRRPWDFGSGRALSSEEQFTTGSQDTGHARYELQAHTGEPMVLEVRTPALRDRSWPYGGEHYATTTAVAFPRLRDLGFSCTDDQCHRAADDQHLWFRRHGDQITSVTFDLADGAAAVPWLSAGLPFLTPAVEPAVRAQLLADLRLGRSSSGVVAGTVLVVETPQPYALGDGRAPGVTVTIGAPLVLPD